MEQSPDIRDLFVQLLRLNKLEWALLWIQQRWTKWRKEIETAPPTSCEANSSLTFCACALLIWWKDRTPLFYVRVPLLTDRLAPGCKARPSFFEKRVGFTFPVRSIHASLTIGNSRPNPLSSLSVYDSGSLPVWRSVTETELVLFFGQQNESSSETEEAEASPSIRKGHRKLALDKSLSLCLTPLTTVLGTWTKGGWSVDFYSIGLPLPRPDWTWRFAHFFVKERAWRTWQAAPYSSQSNSVPEPPPGRLVSPAVIEFPWKWNHCELSIFPIKC